MTVDRTLLIRYLRQLGEHGGQELMLDTITADEAVRMLAGSGVQKPAAAAKASGEAPADPSGAASGSGAPAAAAWAAGSPASAKGAADSETTAALNILREDALGCTKCRLHETRQSVVFGEGSASADVVVVGEAPGAREDETGRPFVGPAGKLLDLLLLSVGLPRDRVFICNVLKCRPPKNRDPQADEVASCSPYLHRQLEIIAPKVLLSVGKFAAQTLADSKQSIGRLRGRVHTYRGIPLVASYHPAYLLRSPSQVQRTWEDFQLLRQVLDEQS